MRYIFIIVVFVSCLYANAFACSCAIPPLPLHALTLSEAVFSGTVVAVQADEQVGGSQIVKVEFAVRGIWKGAFGTRIELLTGESSSLCGYNFVMNEEYLVYATGTSESLGTNICTRTKLLINAKEDLEALGEPLFVVPIETKTWGMIKALYLDTQ